MVVTFVQVIITTQVKSVETQKEALSLIFDSLNKMMEKTLLYWGNWVFFFASWHWGSRFFFQKFLKFLSTICVNRLFAPFSFTSSGMFIILIFIFLMDLDHFSRGLFFFSQSSLPSTSFLYLHLQCHYFFFTWWALFPVLTNASWSLSLSPSSPEFIFVFSLFYWIYWGDICW